jgi:NgoMIV restriction enzyme
MFIFEWLFTVTCVRRRARRLASIAMGTGDMDCVCHAALYELEEAAAESGNEDQAEVLQTPVAGRRLRDIGDLPFDLAI